MMRNFMLAVGMWSLLALPAAAQTILPEETDLKGPEDQRKLLSKQESAVRLAQAPPAPKRGSRRCGPAIARPRFPGRSQGR